MHHACSPTENDLTQALDVVEGIFAAIFEYKSAGDDLAKGFHPKSE